MSDIWLYFTLGLQHVLDWQAYDHMLFLTLLVVNLAIKDWKQVILFVSLFTLGHSASMLLSTYHILDVKSEVVEFLIPVTILCTALYNLKTSNHNTYSQNYIQLGIVILFGCIHGMGFSGYFNMITAGVSSKIIPLSLFALGIEASQIIVVFVVLFMSFLLQTFFKITSRDWRLVVSSIGIGLTLPMVFTNVFW